MCETKEVRSNLDREFAERLRNENSEQFNTLVRMHLSFELDLTTEEYEAAYCEKGKVNKWNRFHKKAKSCTNTKTTSPSETKQNLTKENILQVQQLIDYLIQDQNIIQEGIFRRTGALSRQNELKNQLNLGMPLKLNEGGYTVHDCASVFKGFLSELPEPLLSDAYYPAHCQLAEICNNYEGSSPTDKKESRILQSLQLLILLLPEENRILLKNIIKMLYKIIQYEKQNKMSADSLATLFTPHLICPRKLTPESLHTISQSMSSVVSFMISKGNILFDIPARLATDIRAYFVELKRKKTMSPEQILDESVTSDSTANTIYTFIDREKTAAAHNINPTDTALAQLYAHIQSLPESSKKRKLIKQFNKENGQGTPLQLLMLNRMKTTSTSAIKSSKSLGDSIKKHIFHKSIISKTPKKHITSSSSISLSSSSSSTSVGFNTPIRSGLPIQPKMRVLFQSPISSSYIMNNKSNDNSPFIGKNILKIEKKSLTPTCSPERKTIVNIELSASSDCCDEINEKKTVMFNNVNDDDNEQNQESDDEYFLTTPPDLNDDDIVVKNNNLIEFFTTNKNFKLKYKSEPNLNQIDKNIKLNNRFSKGVSLDNIRFELIDNKNIRTKLKKTISLNKNLNQLKFIDNNKENNNCNRQYLLETTSQRFIIDRRNSMSPITKSTQRMPKSMQESIMTPRSRKPVMLLGVNLETSVINQQNYYNSFSSLPEDNENINDDDEETELMENEKNVLYRSKSEGDFSFEDNEFDDVNNSVNDKENHVTRSTSAPESLTSVFRDYLFTRSVLTATPADLSFSSQPDDFCSTTDIRDLSETEMSESLLYCLDGNKPEDLSFISNESDNINNSSDNDNNLMVINYCGNTLSSTRKRMHADTNDNEPEINENQRKSVCNLQIKKVVLHHGETSL